MKNTRHDLSLFSLLALTRCFYFSYRRFKLELGVLDVQTDMRKWQFQLCAQSNRWWQKLRALILAQLGWIWFDRDDQGWRHLHIEVLIIQGNKIEFTIGKQKETSMSGQGYALERWPQGLLRVLKKWKIKTFEKHKCVFKIRTFVF